MSDWEIGVFASIDAGLGVNLDVVRELDVPTIQLHAPHTETRTKESATRFLSKLAENKLRLTAVFGGFEGESYDDIPAVERTVGLVPLATRAARLAEMKQISDFTQLLQCDVIALHLGFVPHSNSGSGYMGVVEVTRELCDHARGNGQNLHLETGQETADSLLQFITDVDRDNLFVNFDPANMILYGTGEPIDALKKIGAYVRSIHCKDANWSEEPGKQWGEETPLGQGQVNMELYLSTLKSIGYRGPLTIEREIPQEPDRQKNEIGQAVSLLSKLRSELLA